VFATDYQITDFGAVRGAYSTPAIQAAIDAAAKAGGGRVVVPAGKFITGTIVLKSNVELFLEPGSELESSTQLEHFLSTYQKLGMVFCEDAENISISGTGTINALGSTFYETDQNHVYEEFDKNLTRQKNDYMPEGEFYTDGPLQRKPRPGMTIVFFHCTNVKVTGITIKDTPVWATRFGYCDNVVIDKVAILNNLMIPNSDGLHFTASKNIRISNCHLECGDDCIILTGFPKDEETPGYNTNEIDQHTYGNRSVIAGNIQVSNCFLQSRSSGIRVGYGQHPIRQGIFTNIIISGSNRGIGIFAHDEAFIEDLIFSDIIINTRLHNGQWWGNGEPIHLSSVSRFEKEPPGLIRNIQFNNITATGEHGIILYALEDRPMENISFANIKLHIKNGQETLTYGGNFDLRPAADPELRLFQHDIPGVYAKYVNQLEINDLTLSWDKDLPDYFTNGIELEHCKGAIVSDFNGMPARMSTHLAAVKISDSEDFKMVDCIVPPQYNELIK
jgi:hypothetical protein